MLIEPRIESLTAQGSVSTDTTLRVIQLSSLIKLISARKAHRAPGSRIAARIAITALLCQAPRRGRRHVFLLIGLPFQAFFASPLSPLGGLPLISSRPGPISRPRGYTRAKDNACPVIRLITKQLVSELRWRCRCCCCWAAGRSAARVPRKISSAIRRVSSSLYISLCFLLHAPDVQLFDSPGREIPYFSSL